MKMKTNIQIKAQIEDVFEYIKNGTNLNEWNSAVISVNKIEKSEIPENTQYYHMIRKLPKGQAENEIEILHDKKNTIQIRTISGLTPFVYKFVGGFKRGITYLFLYIEINRKGIIDLFGNKTIILPNFALKAFVRNAVNSNLYSLKAILESKDEAYLL
jgi:hypothetical protein